MPVAVRDLRGKWSNHRRSHYSTSPWVQKDFPLQKPQWCNELTQQVFTECLLCTRDCTKCWGHSSEQGGKGPAHNSLHSKRGTQVLNNFIVYWLSRVLERKNILKRNLRPACFSAAIHLTPAIFVHSLTIPQTFMKHSWGASSKPIKNWLSSGDKRRIRYRVPLSKEQRLWWWRPQSIYLSGSKHIKW